MAEKKSVNVEKAAPVSKAKAATKKTAAKKASPALSVDQLEKEIRAQAQKVYENRQAKGLAGDELSDWLAAEVVIKKKYKL